MILLDDLSKAVLSLVLIVEREQNETKAATSLCNLVTHHDCLDNATKVLEVNLHVLLRSLVR